MHTDAQVRKAEGRPTASRTCWTSSRSRGKSRQLGGRAIADDDPIIPQLNDLFGEHTFLLDPHGLNIVEPVEEASGPAAMSAKIVNLASWSDDDCRFLFG